MTSRPQLPVTVPNTDPAYGANSEWAPGFSATAPPIPTSGTLYKEFELSRITMKTRRVLVGDFRGYAIGGLAWNLAAFNAVADGLNNNGTPGFGTRRHANRGNWLMADLHVATLDYQVARQGYSNPALVP
jgi:prepilin-type processing-associated H-X9-DG protein